MGNILEEDIKNTDQAVIQAVRKTAKLGIALVVVSRGAKGIIALDRQTGRIWKALIDVSHLNPPKQAIGSGDALVAGFAVCLAKGKCLENSIRLGVSCGAANLFSISPGLCDPELMRKFQPLVEIKQIF